MKRAVAFFVAGIGLVTGCMVMNDLSLVDPTDPQGTSSGGTSGKTSSGTNGGTSGASGTLNDPTKCNLLKEPAKPAKADEGGSDTTLTFAMRQMVPNNEGTPFGLDLDGICTCFTPVGATSPGPDACKRATSACDDPQNIGLDNAGSVLFRQISKGGGVNLVDVENGHLAQGDIGLVIQVSGYNGLPNDNAVTVRFIRTDGVSGGPSVDRVDTWPESEDNFTSTEAWVTTYEVKGEEGGVTKVTALSAHFAEVEVPFTISTPSPARMKGAIITGTIVDGKIPELLVAGRSNTKELVNAVGQLDIPFIGTLCQTIPVDDKYKTFGTAACGVSDLPTDPALTGDLTTPCDAMSFGVKMLMIPAKLGNPASLRVGGDRCGGVSGYPLACPNP